MKSTQKVQPSRHNKKQFVDEKHSVMQFANMVKIVQYILRDSADCNDPANSSNTYGPKKLGKIIIA